ncbi:MAG: hypothetical protein IKC82_05225 [Lentisphaeria bacterium]|nr:hypothetical protein [Lentisphaeria bacterium]
MADKRYRDGIDGGILDDGRLRIVLLGIFFLAAFGVLICRLYYLQLHHGEDYRRKIAGQSERQVRIAGVRGSIYSADGILLAGNKRSYDLLFFPRELHQGKRRKTVENMHNLAAVLAGASGRAEFPDKEKFDRHLQQYPGVPMVVFRDLTDHELARIFEATRQVKGVDVQYSPVRYYPCGDRASHIVGYTRKIDPETASDRKEFFYYNHDIEGVSGIEKAFDTFSAGSAAQGLRALPGRSVIQVNIIGYAHRELLGRVEPVHGNDVILTLEDRAQKLAEELLGSHTGAMVLLNADNGDILCAATSPRIDLARFTPRLSPEYYRQLLKDPGKPLINRAFQAIYPPGSTIKPLMCLAFLQAGIDPDEEIYCPGDSTIGNTSIGCSAHRYYGDDMSMVRALEKSCNNYMIHHAVKVGMETLTEALKRAGFGLKHDLKIPENSGDLPSRELKKRRYGTNWTTYDTALLSIGQGIISVTPLQLAVYTAAIANGGKVWQPQLVKKVLDKRGIACFESTAQLISTLNASPEALATIRQGMFQVVNSPGGSGRQGKVDGLDIYGKTGTAEIGSRSNRRNITHFISFTNFQGRNYALAITVEDGRSGGRTCAPLAAEFFRRYLLSQ